jgi:LexA-binding, inner membrane-associated putative hydrolase
MPDMLPPGHIAAGALQGARRSARSRRHPLLLIGGGIAIAILPDLDLLIPRLLSRVGVAHELRSGTHHTWVTHTPLFWGLVGLIGRRLAARPAAPSWAPEAAAMLATGTAVHLAQDTFANRVALLWPVRRREYGLQLDRLPGVTDHADYVRRYPASPAGRVEALLIVAAVLECMRRL